MNDSFGVSVFEYLKTLVPQWRLCDEAWLLGEDHLVGIGLERNYGGQLMVVPWPDGGLMQHPALPAIEPALKAAGKRTELSSSSMIGMVTLTTGNKRPSLRFRGPSGRGSETTS
jgi:hypothetical protein